MAASKRITKELKDLSQSPVEGVTVSLPNESDLNKWTVRMEGPKDTAFVGGIFLLDLNFPTAYPFKPPALAFRTKIYHPNVSNDDKGSMCLGLLRPDEWKPATRCADVLRFAIQLLREPNVDDAIEQGIAAEYRDRRAEWEKTAKDWTKKYAKAEGK